MADYGDHEDAMQRYCREGETRAFALDNRGPLRFGDDGKLHPAIAAAYDRHGVYIFEGVISAEEIDELTAAFVDLFERLPSSPESTLDRHGRPALGSDHDAMLTSWSKPLGDPFGGTDIGNNRHPLKMFEPVPAAGLPDQVPISIMGPLQYSDAALRLYGHPSLLALAASVNGDDFTPYIEAFLIKKPGEGNSFAWHQDGATHWHSPGWDAGIHGINLMVQLYGSTAANGVWFVPGTHRLGKADIPALVAAAGSERLPDAVPMITKPGDVVISNRQVLHGSFANTSPDWRVTFTMGFHRRSAVLGVTSIAIGALAPGTYDNEWIGKRSALIGYAIDARRQHYPDEQSFIYQPHAAAGSDYRWNDSVRPSLRGYNKFDIFV
jgi:hypothetical protein